MTDENRPDGVAPDGQPDTEPAMPAAARRALAEAQARRTAASAPDLPKEWGGPTGPEPVRYGDWEKKGLAVDF